MNTQIREMLDKNDYHFRVRYKDGVTTASIPNRKQEPVAEDFSVEYRLEDKGINIQSPGNYEMTIHVPKYAQRAILMIDILRICEQINFSPSLIEFYVGDDTNEQSEDVMLMSMGKVSEKEKKFFGFVAQAKTSLIPFHPDFDVEAKKMGFEKGYMAVKNVFFGGK